MKNLWTIFRRELGAYFNSGIAYIFAIVFIVFNNGLFMLQFFQLGKADMRLFFNAMPFILTIFIPAISMRLWAEEKRTSTYELLLTFPMRPQELVLGKYFAGLAFYALTLACTLSIPLMLASIGRTDGGPIAGGYAGAFFLGALFLAMGIFLSGLTKDQIVAFILTMMATFAIFFLGTDLLAATIDGWVPGLGTMLRNSLGASGHLVSFSRGIIDVRDIVYFVMLTAAFLFLNGLSLEGRFKPKAKAVYSAAIALAVVSVVLANWLLHDIPLGRFDLTEGKIYTMSGVSKRILRELKVPVTVKFYVSPSDRMPTALKSLEQDAKDKLEELKIASGGNFQYSIIHVDSDATEEERAALQEKGVAPFQVESVQKDEVGVKLIYSSLTLEYKEKPIDLLPRIVPASLFDLEYQLLSRIFKMTLEEKPKVALFAPMKKESLDPELAKILEASGQKESADLSDQFRTAATLIRNNGYDLVRVGLSKDSAIPERAKMLLLLAPGALTDRQRWEINRYLVEGGTVVVAAQGFEYTYTRETGGVEGQIVPQSLDINKLIDKWGVKISDQILLDLNSQVISLSTGQRIGPYALEMPVKLPNQIVVDESMIQHDSPLTNRLPSLFFLWGSALDLDPGTAQTNGLKTTVLFTSSPKSWLKPNDGSNLTEKNTEPPADMKGKYPLAVFAEGQFPNAFGADAMPKWAEADAAEETPKLSPKPGRLVVVGDAKAFSEELIQNPGNINLFANIIDGLTLGTDLIEIRTKTPILRDLKRLSEGQKFWYKFFTIAFMPLVLAAAAGTRFFIRKKEKEMYLAARNG